jgi:hypothetical protein
MTVRERRERSFTGTTLLPDAATTNIGRSGEPARAAGGESSARVIRTVAPSSATRARSCWIKRASNSISRKRALTASAAQWFQERNFAEAAVQHGFKRARWRGLWRQSIQDYLIAAIQNLRIIAKNQKHLLLALTRSLVARSVINSQRYCCYPQLIAGTS